MKKTDFRTPLKKVKGDGAAKHGTGHFIRQRISAIALIPLTFLFMCVLLRILSADNYQAVAGLLANPFWATVLILFLFAGFYHGALGMQVIIEDYVHVELTKILLIVAIRFAAIFLAVIGVLSVLFIAFR